MYLCTCIMYYTANSFILFCLDEVHCRSYVGSEKCWERSLVVFLFYLWILSSNLSLLYIIMFYFYLHVYSIYSAIQFTLMLILIFLLFNGVLTILSAFMQTTDGMEWGTSTSCFALNFHEVPVEWQREFEFGKSSTSARLDRRVRVSVILAFALAIQSRTQMFWLI